MRHLLRSARWAAVVLGFVMLLAACSLPTESEPREIAAERLPSELDEPEAPATTVDPASAEATFIYVVTTEGDEQRLKPVPVSFEPSDEETPEHETRRRLEVLLDPLELGEGEATLIPEDVQLLDFELDDDGTVTVSLSEEFALAEGSTARLATAQIVYTVSPPGSRVRFRIDDELVEVAGEEGAVARVVTRDDYEDIGPSG